VFRGRRFANGCEITNVSIRVVTFSGERSSISSTAGWKRLDLQGVDACLYRKKRVRCNAILQG